jgi:hypothetical protein
LILFRLVHQIHDILLLLKRPVVALAFKNLKEYQARLDIIRTRVSLKIHPDVSQLSQTSNMSGSVSAQPQPPAPPPTSPLDATHPTIGLTRRCVRFCFRAIFKIMLVSCTIWLTYLLFGVSIWSWQDEYVRHHVINPAFVALVIFLLITLPIKLFWWAFQEEIAEFWLAGGDVI